MVTLSFPPSGAPVPAAEAAGPGGSFLDGSFLIGFLREGGFKGGM